MTAAQMQTEFLTRARQHAQSVGLAEREPYRQVLELWERTLKAFEAADLSLVETEIDWVLKWRTLQRYADRAGLPMSDPRLQQLDLAWHDIHPTRGLFNIVSRRGGAAEVVTAERIVQAGSVPPQTTRARLRGEFVRVAQEHQRDFSVDWVHLKLNDSAQRTVLCKDPFVSQDDRIDELIASMERGR
jgi:proteasome accessory factor A